MEIQLVPTVESSASVKKQFEEVLNRCLSVKGAVAFWTIPINYISSLSSKLSNEESFFCVDIHLPTDIEVLAEFTRKKSKIFLHDYQLAAKFGIENRIPSLLHAKIIHFELEDYKTETWIGSHNFTRRALDGINFEATTIIRTEQKTKEEIKFVNDVINYLELIKDNCIEFDLNDIDFYKALQGENEVENEVDVIEIVGKNIANLPEEKTIQIISKDVSNFDKYKLVNKKVILHCLDIDTQKEHIFKTTILNAGAINALNEKSYEITFSHRRYAIREKDMLPYLQFQNVIDAELLKISQNYINLEIESELLRYKIYEKPAKKDEIWDYLSNSIHINRMESEDIKSLFAYRKLPIKKGNKKNLSFAEISLREIITRKDQKYLVDYYEGNSCRLKYQTIDEIENKKIPKAIKRKQLFVKRIMKRIEDSQDKKNC